MLCDNTIEVADAKKLWEPAGWEHSGGKSAESVSRAREPDGDGGNTSVTVCGAVCSIVALSARMKRAFHDRWIRSPAILFLERKRMQKEL